MTQIRGQVSSFAQRYEATPQGTITVWDFRLDRHDDTGKPLPRVPLEMRGTTFDGAIAVGDWIEVDAPWRDGRTLKVKRVTNLSSNAIVEALDADQADSSAAKESHPVRSFFKFIFIAAALGIFALIVITAVSQG
jgi:hypothetical protein